MNDEQIKYVRELEMKNQEQEQQAHDTSRTINSVFQSSDNENIIEWQLDLREQLENIGHSLRGHVIATDSKGMDYWKEPEDKENVIFTEYGVQEILRFLLQYLNKNTILSNYSELIIDCKVYDAGYELVDLVFTRYEKFFYVTPIKELIKRYPDITVGEVEDTHEDERKEKEKHFPIIIRPIIDAIHSSFLRALNGGERNSLRSARLLTQTESGMTNDNNMQMPMQIQQNKHWYKPTTWGK